MPSSNLNFYERNAITREDLSYGRVPGAPCSDGKTFFCYIWQEDIAKISKVPGAPRNVNQARVIWLVGETS